MKKLFYFRKIGSILMIFAASFTSCKQDETAIPNPINEVSKNDESSSSLVSETLSCNSKDRFAKVLSKAIVDNDMLEFVLNEAKRLENGDPTFLYALAKQKKTNQGLTFSQKLTDADETKDDFFTKKVLSEDPLTSIFLYVPENLKLATVTSIKKVYYYCSTDEGDMNASVIYYENGNKYSTLKSILPTEPVMVVLPNDRVKAERNAANLKANSANYKLLGTDDNQHYILEGYFPTKATEDKEPNSTLTTRWCTRDIYKQREGVYRFLFSDNLESWFLGGPEILVNMLMLQSGSANRITNVFNLSNNQKNTWIAFTHEPITWNTNIYGNDYMRYHISEQDGSTNNGTFTFGLTIMGVGGLNFSFGDNSDDLYGESDAYYCDWVSPDSWGQHYYAGSGARFYVNVK